MLIFVALTALKNQCGNCGAEPDQYIHKHKYLNAMIETSLTSNHRLSHSNVKRII